jgi:hypothetical protein
MENITEKEEERRGLLLVDVLNLKPCKGETRTIDGKERVLYCTTWGTKTALGLYRTVERIIKDGE